MQPKTIQQINAELGSVYDPQVENVRKQQAEIPGMIQAEEAGLGAKQEQAFGDILGGARRRGLGFSGIPLQEQAKYTSTEYMPALARLRQSGRDQQMKLEDAVLGINERRAQQAQGNYQYENTLAEQRRQFDAEQAQKQAALRAQQQSMANPTMGGAAGQQGLPAGMTARTNALGRPTGFNFNVGGKAASAAQFANANKIPIGELLYSMAAQGDSTAANAYNWMQNLQKNDPKGFASGAFKNTPAYKNTFSSLFWGS